MGEPGLLLTAPAKISYIEEKLKEKGVRGKVIPSEEEMDRLAEGKYREKVRGWVNEVIAEVLASDELKNKMAHEFQDRIKLQGAKAWIETEFKHRDDSKSWRDALEDTLQRAYEAKHKSGLEEARYGSTSRRP